MHKHTGWLVYNSRSGSFQEGLLRDIADALNASGTRLAGTTDCCSDELPDQSMLEREEVGILVVFGGDGTLSSVASSVAGWPGSMLPLPGGTANLLCRDLFGDRDLPAILADLAANRLAPRQHFGIAFSSGCALIEIVAGPGALWADAREQLREFDLAGALNKGFEAAGAGIAGPRVTIADPEIEPGKPLAALRLVPQSDGLALYGYGASEVGDFIAHGIAVLTRSFRENNYEKLAMRSEVVCGTDDGSPLSLMVDGERVDVGGEVRFWLEPFVMKLHGLADD